MVVPFFIPALSSFKTHVNVGIVNDILIVAYSFGDFRLLPYYLSSLTIQLPGDAQLSARPENPARRRASFTSDISGVTYRDEMTCST